MAIETICKGCARKLRVGDEFAGRKARCPHCKTIYTVPAAGVGLDASTEPASDSGDKWLLRTKDGSVYGPVSKPELDGWVNDGRLDTTSQLQLEGEATWRQATEIYPALIPKPAPSDSPFSIDTGSPAQGPNPYSSPRTAGPMVRAVRPHRGGMILMFGVLGFACCQIFSIVAWVMGHADLKEIKAGRMDPEGRGLTQAGMIIGIIGTVLMILGIGVQMIMVLFMIISEA